MSWFVSHRMREPRLPGRFLPALRQLDRFLDLLRDLGADTPVLDDEEDREELAECHALLMEMGEGVMAPSPHLVDEADARRAFCAGMMRLSWFPRTVLGAVPLVDTAGSKTLPAWRCDLGLSRAQLRAKLERLFPLSQEEWATIDAGIASELAPLVEQEQVMRALQELDPLEPGASDLDAAVWRWFSRLFPGHPLREGEVKVVRSATSLYFCLPYKGDQWKGEPREAAEEAKVRGFLKKQLGFQQRYLTHFPMFGFFEGHHADPATLDAVAERSGLPRARVERLLTSMVAILATPEVDKYIVHDLWGHGWQALLFRFEEGYAEAAGFRRLPRLDEPVELEEGGTVTLRGLIDEALIMGRPPQPRWDRFVNRVLTHRLSISMVGLVAELLADVVEEKFLHRHPDLAPLMPSSSHFKEEPAKLDLTMIDLPHYQRLAQRGFRRFADRARVREALAEAYLRPRPDATREEVLAVLGQCAEHTAALLDQGYRRTFHYTFEDGGTVFLNVYARLTLNALGLVSAVNRCMARWREELPAAPGFRGFEDALVFTAASFYEQDPVKHLWHVDEFVEGYFERFWRVLAADTEASAGTSTGTEEAV